MRTTLWDISYSLLLPPLLSIASNYQLGTDTHMKFKAFILLSYTTLSAS